MNSRNQSMLNIWYCSQGGYDYINQLVTDQQIWKNNTNSVLSETTVEK